ncbi:DoxX family protein [Pseudoclavibacter chungangensis]|uniref:DoxX family protein n=1 Tax=Pseudoclavibacter chungangensis TaxID=587635 RepID=A0A7J5BQM7_9MICO|nr:DoxX family protein [Pseudoclavibacter chungangensis]KAB1653591.1 DoxX family protein [Pseudoclavibacter chungangensis]NYJ68693.1 putative membrane protein YphA (DoxX/SURF4 family) [Pseudoclavibacter chungangensis]
MIIALWIVNAILALIFLAAGVMKLARSREALASSGLAWTADASPGTVKAVGAVEVAGAVGLIAPLATGIAPILTPLAAIGLALTMIGAIVLHVRRHERFTVPVVLLVIAAASAALGFAVR